MKLSNPFKKLNKFEWGLYITSLTVSVISFIVSGMQDYLTFVSSITGVTALIFVSKGMVIGQVLTMVFSLLYGVVSIYFKYYGEVITYLCMSMPMALVSVVSWIKHPYKDSHEVEVSKLTVKKLVVLSCFAIVVTVAFYYILEALGTTNVLVSTISVTTSFFAASLTFLRSPYYAIGYSANDIVLIVLWVLASIEQISYLPMVFCFVMFLANDLYGFYYWKEMQKRQKDGL
ncbi:MAG: nicotinamide mononucleotide transporter [Clostridiales bacterium]|nr:nicotinamide mononucleotide transporter [Clostridiales bacterium]